MSNQLNTSRVFDAPRMALARLREQPWTQHPTSGKLPHVTMVTPDWDAHLETVWVVPQVGEDASIEWITAPNGRHEQFDLTFVIRTLANNPKPDVAEIAAWDRLEELADIVQRAFYWDQALTDGMTEVTRMMTLGTHSVAMEGFTGVSASLFPAGSDGVIGEAVLLYHPHFRI